MPKMKAVRGDRVVRGGPLAQDILSEDQVKESSRQKVRKRREGDDEFVESDLTKKILTEARKQQLELEEEHGMGQPKQSQDGHAGHSKGKKIFFTQRDDDDDEITEDDHRAASAEGMLGIVDVDPDEERAFEAFMARKGHRTLADIIQSKLTEKKTEIESVMSDGQGAGIQDLPQEVVRMYSSVRDILKSYRSGKLPIAFKTLPVMEQWEQCLYITRPDQWSAAAMNAASRIFSSNLPGVLAQRFYSLFLLPRIRDDIAEYKRLNFHLMQSLKRALFKTSAFFKGIVFALIESGDCTLREALIISSIIREHSIPVGHAGAAIDRICQLDYTGASSIFLRTLLDKKYALSYSVVDAVCDHFLRFMRDERQMPVLWHQALLTFAQRYKGDLYQGQKDELYKLMGKHFHPEITPEVRRELDSHVSTRQATRMEMN
ncbi:bystin-like [Babylonia areolata]|uniref:bystin-like n=1 Tax=Babylonia areolata TaxID=304850 RepID=UPI003FD40818